jgi:putative transposon-encoded protein
MQLEGMNMAVEVKTIGSSGQISIGKQHAGRTVTVEEIEKGVWLVKAARVIPESELWLHNASARRTLDRAVAWAAEKPPKSSDLDKLEAKLKKRR